MQKSKAELGAYRGDLKNHSENEKHRQNMKKILSDKQISVKSHFQEIVTNKKSEIKLSVYAACHFQFSQLTV